MKKEWNTTEDLRIGELVYLKESGLGQIVKLKDSLAFVYWFQDKQTVPTFPYHIRKMKEFLMEYMNEKAPQYK